MPSPFVEIYIPKDQHEVMMIKMLLERDGVEYVIANEHINSILPPSGLWGLASMRLMVRENVARRCREVLREELDFV
ncbi:MAG: putative signal transducing protein [Burkholderiales bacterium]